MFQFLFLAAIPATMTTSTISDPAAGQAVRAVKNGEFLAKNYPARALAAGEQGKVGFRIVVEPDGSLGSCEVTESSGFASLDNETCELIVRHARLPIVRNSEGRSVRAVQNGHINWVHPSGKNRLTAGVKQAALDKPDKVVCKRTPTTGSLIKRTKQCMTSQQWAETQRIAREQADRLVAKGYASDGMGCPLLNNPSGECN
jgi:TonB family protein